MPSGTARSVATELSDVSAESADRRGRFEPFSELSEVSAVARRGFGQAASSLCAVERVSAAHPKSAGGSAATGCGRAGACAESPRGQRCRAGRDRQPLCESRASRVDVLPEALASWRGLRAPRGAGARRPSVATRARPSRARAHLLQRGLAMKSGARPRTPRCEGRGRACLFSAGFERLGRNASVTAPWRRESGPTQAEARRVARGLTAPQQPIPSIAPLLTA